MRGAAVVNTNWRDLYDARTGIHVRVSPEVLQRLGAEGVFQVARHLKARNPQATPRNALRATGYLYTVNGLQLFAGVFLLKDGDSPVPVFLISTREQWEEYHVDREQRN